MKQSVSKAVFAIGILSLLASFAVAGLGTEWNVPGGKTSSEVSPEVQTIIRQDEAVIGTVSKAEPSVVSVIISQELPVMERVPDSEGEVQSDPFLRRFFTFPQYRQNGTQERQVGGGTAFFVDANGLLMTNKHVVADAKAKYSVLLNDGRTLQATVVALDPSNDIALMKVDGTDFVPLTMAPDDELHLGQTAIAIGNSLGEFRNTVSVGVVSGLRRSIVAGGRLSGPAEKLEEIIQTDAAINEGNSGGPLLDILGRVIGMNTAIAAGQNIGFALPARELRRVLESYLEHGRIVRSYLGVRYAYYTPELKKELNVSYEYDYGVMVVAGENQNEPAVVPGSPAGKAGIEEKDLILEANGQKLTQDVSLAALIQQKSPGETITLKVLHDGRLKDLNVILEELKE